MSDLPDPVSQAEAILGYSFTDAGLMRRALTHASAAEDRLESNERMEFLGDAVLGLVACQRIYEKYFLNELQKCIKTPDQGGAWKVGENQENPPPLMSLVTQHHTQSLICKR